jgi:hypothetical protein
VSARGGAVLARLALLVAVPLAGLVVGCGSSSSGPPAPPASWHVVLSDLEATLLCVWGTRPDDVFATGGGLGNGTPAVVLHYDGAAWTDLAPGGTDTFWWANGTSDHDVWTVGEHGRIAHWDGAAFHDYASGTTATLYGVWAAAANDVWAVGGTPGAGTSAPNDVALHFDGTSWSDASPPQKLGLSFFKVWGAASDDLYIVGEGGTVWHRSGATWSLESMPSVQGTLLTVNGCGPGEIYAVGGRDVLRSDGTSWTVLPVSQTLENDVNGVACDAPGRVVVVGGGGLKERLAGGQWSDDFADDPHTDLHGAWADSAGGYWAAGGDFVSGPVDGGARAGVLAYYGGAPPSSVLRFDGIRIAPVP